MSERLCSAIRQYRKQTEEEYVCAYDISETKVLFKFLEQENAALKARIAELDEGLNECEIGFTQTIADYERTITDMKGRLAELEKCIHYPEHCDTIAFPTFGDALYEIGCSECDNPNPSESPNSSKEPK